MRIADRIFEIVKEYTDTVYFVPGGGAMYLVDAIGRSKLKRVSCLHEQGAAFAACGHALITGRLGVCLTTSGPGATNAVTGCLAAWMDSIPVLFISGQVRRNMMIGASCLRSRGIQEARIADIVRPITRWSFVADEKCEGVLRKIVSEAMYRRPAPVWLDVPQDVQAMEVKGD
jgi:acetolactate synthase-1/2/3 large subunit